MTYSLPADVRLRPSLIHQGACDITVFGTAGTGIDYTHGYTVSILVPREAVLAEVWFRISNDGVLESRSETLSLLLSDAAMSFAFQVLEQHRIENSPTSPLELERQFSPVSG